MISTISYYTQVDAPDWGGLRGMDPREASVDLGAMLKNLDGFEKKIFALRGMAMLLIEERELWRYQIDPEVDRPYESRDRWLKAICPTSFPYCYEALKAVKELREIPAEDLIQMSRSNIQTLTHVSSNVRRLPEVIKAAKTQSESEFTQTLTTKYDQHLEGRRTLRLSYSASDYAAVMDFLTSVGKLLPEPTEDPATALLAYAIDWGLERSE